jgi:hypothetical protein
MTEKANGKATVTKKEAVRQALAALGWDRPRAEMAKFIKDKFNLEMDLDHISSCKGEIQKESKAKKKKAAAPKQPAAKVEAPKHPASQGISLDDIELAKRLIERVGADSLKKLIGMLTK